MDNSGMKKEAQPVTIQQRHQVGFIGTKVNGEINK